eukprot:scaffold163589_cov18-Tisochrysis_lutea.AAC.1
MRMCILAVTMYMGKHVSRELKPEIRALYLKSGFKQVEAKYPALLFKQQLDAFVQKIFPMIRDNVKKQISPMVSNCIHTPKGLSARPRTGAAAEQ